MEEDPLICSLCEKEQALWYCSVDSAYFCESCDESVHQNGMVARHQHLWLGCSPIVQAQQSQQQRFMEAEPLRLLAAARKKRRSNRQGAGVGISKVMKTEPTPSIVPSSAAQYFGFEEESLQHVPFIPQPQNSYSHCSEHAVPNLGDSSSAGSAECADALEEYDVDEFLNSAADYCEDESGICSFISSESTGFTDFPQMEDSLGILGFYDGREESEYAGAIRNSNVAPNCLPESEDDLKKLTANVSIIKSEKVEEFNAGQGREEDWTRQRICLRLDYEDILNVWSNKGAFCTDESSRRTRAVSVPDDSSSDAAGSSEMGVVPDMEENGGREARVTRYREKRRTRLFSKKIRYEVRKLNAERRPRLKGRFIKRANDL